MLESVNSAYTDATVHYSAIANAERAESFARRLRTLGFVSSTKFANDEFVIFSAETVKGFHVLDWSGLRRALAAAESVRPLVRMVRLPHLGDLPLPSYETAGAAGMDLRAALGEGVLKAEIVVLPGNYAFVPAGFLVAVPEGFEMQVRPRSGLAAKHGISIVNTPGTVDSDYRGEVKVILINHGTKPFDIKHGDRIAQAVIAPVVQARISEVESLDSTTRGAGGFGSTGRA